jgi:1,4-dihydroxy-6-naphthoate synthase
MIEAPAKTIRVGHSPDSDDAFMFYALTHDKLDTGGLRFVHQLEDIETLNRRALNGELEVSAVSIHAFAHLADRYALLASGSSMGDRYGPTLVTREPTTLDELRGQTIAVPGLLTTAYLTLQLCLGKDVPVTVMPFDRILPAVAEGRARAGLLIHEGQLYYKDRGLHKVVDLGAWWYEQTGLPLPLGGNVVRKDLGSELVSRIARLLKESIQFALANRKEALDYALGYARGLDPALADRFVGM